MKKLYFFLLIIFILFLSSISIKAEVSEIKFGGENYLIGNYEYFKAKYQNLNRPVVGISLTGGGAKAMVNFGVIKALEDEGIPIDFLVGTSMGAIVSVLYGSGLNTEQILNVVTSTYFGQLVDLRPGKRESLIGTERLNLFLEKISPNKKLENFKIPAALLSIELNSGKKYLTTTGNISDVIQGSYSIPYYFPIENRGDKNFIDAGILEATPVKSAAVLGADFIIVTKLKEEEKIKNLDSSFASTSRFLSIIQNNFSKQIINNYADFVIELDIKDYNFMDFNQIEKLVEIGYKTTMSRMPALKKELVKQGIKTVKYPARDIHDISEVMSDLKNKRFISEKDSEKVFLNYGQDKSYFNQDLIIPFVDNLQTIIRIQRNNVIFDLKGDEFFGDGYEAKIESKKLSKKIDFYFAYGNDYDKKTDDNYRFELKYYNSLLNTGFGFGHQNNQSYYLLSGDFALDKKRFNWQSENDLTYNQDSKNSAILSSNILNLKLYDKWQLEGKIVYNNTELLNSPLIYRGQNLSDLVEFQAALDFKYMHNLLDPIYIAGFFQTTDIGGYLFFDYFDNHKDNGKAAGIGFNSQVYLLGLRPVEVDLYIAYDFEREDDRIALEVTHEF